MALLALWFVFEQPAWQLPNTLSSDLLFGHFVWLQGKTGVSGQQTLAITHSFLVRAHGRARCRLDVAFLVT
jgi:hypothetical protein